VGITGWATGAWASGEAGTMGWVTVWEVWVCCVGCAKGSCGRGSGGRLREPAEDSNCWAICSSEAAGPGLGRGRLEDTCCSKEAKGSIR